MTAELADGLSSQQPPAADWLAGLGHADPDVRRLAVAAWRSVAAPLKDALPGLTLALRDRSPDVRREAVSALGVLGQVALALAPAARSALKGASERDPDDVIRARALDELLLIGPQVQTPVPALVEALQDGVAAVRREAAETLGELGPAAKPAVGTLIRATHDPDPGVRVRVALALWRIDRRDRIAVPILIDLLTEGDEVLRWQAAEALGEIGPMAADAAEPLRVALGHEYRSVLIHQAVASALQRIERNAPARGGSD